MMNFIFVALGGAVGAIARYALSLIAVRTEFPLMTFITNIAGAFCIGLIVGMAEKHQISDNLILFLKTGFCGGFTTFSTFSLETYHLLEKGAFFTGSIYAVCSMICCLFGVWCGKKTALLCR